MKDNIDYSLSESGLFHFLQLMLFHASLWVDKTPLCLLTPFICLSTDGQLGCFYFLAVVKGATMNMGMQVSLLLP